MCFYKEKIPLINVANCCYLGQNLFLPLIQKIFFNYDQEKLVVLLGVLRSDGCSWHPLHHHLRTFPRCSKLKAFDPKLPKLPPFGAVVPSSISVPRDLCPGGKTAENEASAVTADMNN